MMRDHSADVLDCPNETCREGVDTDTGQKCRECEGNGYVMGSNAAEPPFDWRDLD